MFYNHRSLRLYPDVVNAPVPVELLRRECVALSKLPVLLFLKGGILLVHAQVGKMGHLIILV